MERFKISILTNGDDFRAVKNRIIVIPVLVQAEIRIELPAFCKNMQGISCVGIFIIPAECERKERSDSGKGDKKNQQ